MSETRNLDWLINRLKFYLNINEGQTDQDLIGPSTDTDKWYRDVINQSYENEVEDAKQSGSHSWFSKVHEFTWASSVITLEFPEQINEHTLYDLTDVTDSEVGFHIVWALNNGGGDVFWKDNKTMQWGTEGPGQDTTIRARYLANAVPMTKGTDEPELIASKFRWILVWGSAILARKLLDEDAPRSWEQELDDCRARWQKYLTMGRPMVNNPPAIRISDPEYF